MSNDHRRRTFWLIVLGSLFLLIGIGWFLYWLFIGQFYVYTEDAYVAGNQVMLTPQISSSVKAIYADETDLVEQGQMVVELEQLDTELAYTEKKEALAYTVREVAQLFENVLEREAMVFLKRAELIQARLDFSHRVGLIGTGAISVEEFEQYETNTEVAEAALALAQRELQSAKLLVENTTIETHPLVEEAVLAVKTSYLNLIRCQIWAPVTGYVAKRSVQVGDQVNAGDVLLMIVPLDDLWLEANYKETKLSKVRIDQPVTFTADLYGRSFTYHGHVIGFSAGTGSAFALLPAENASGNWIKIIQRVPIRISIDPQDLRERPLVIGLSLRVHVDVHDTSGKMLAKIPTMEPIYTTPIYSTQAEEMEAIDPLIQDIIEQNSGTQTNPYDETS